MRMAKFLAIAMIALTTTGQIGWGQEAAPESERVRMLLDNVQRLTRQNQALALRLQIAGIEVKDALATPTPYIDLDFPGGSFATLIERLKAGNPRENIMLDESAGAMNIPPFEAFGVTPVGAIWIAKSIMDDGRNLRIETINPRDGSAVTTIVRAERHAPADYEPSSKRIPTDAPTKAWNLKGWTMGNEAAIQNTLAAIQVGMESYDSPVVLQYHEPSGVLLARGNSQQIAFIDSIIRAAAEGAGMGLSADDLEAQIQAADNRLAMLEGELKVVQARTQVAIATLEEAKEFQQSKTTIARAEVDIAEAEAKHAEVSNNILRTKERRAALRAKLETMKASSPSP